MVSKVKLNMVFSTNTQKVLSFFLDRPGEEFVASQIQKVTKVSKSGTNYAIRDLVQVGLVGREKKGNMFFCSLNHASMINRQLKVIKTMISLEEIIIHLSALSSLVVLYGSSFKGEDMQQSDIDLFIVTAHPFERIEKIFQKKKLKRKIQAVIKTGVGYVEMKKKDPYFYEQVAKGIVLWEKLS